MADYPMSNEQIIDVLRRCESALALLRYHDGELIGEFLGEREAFMVHVPTGGDAENLRHQCDMAVYTLQIPRGKRENIMADTATYNEALTVFRDLCEGVPLDFSNEYVRGGVNLIADLFGVVEVDVHARMDEVLADLNRIPMFAKADELERYGVKPYVHNPDNLPL